MKICALMLILFITIQVSSAHSRSPVGKRVRRLIRSWAPLVWLAPGEEFLPLGVPEFLENVRFQNDCYLRTRSDLEELLQNKSSFLYGRKPWKDVVPVYAFVENCAPAKSNGRFIGSTSGSPDESENDIDGNSQDAGRKIEEIDTVREGNRDRLPHFHVTYWMFYPFSEGKSICVVDLGYLGSWPIPLVGGRCFGSFKEYGSHVGDWEHMSLFFKGYDHPLSMYVSAHDAGAFYRYDALDATFVYEGQETRKGIFQKPIFPERVFTAGGSHPVLFSARGSHGLWTAPGKHKFVRLPRLYDESGFGSPWPTWRKTVIISRENNEATLSWMNYKGRWGNPKSNCHPLAKLGINFCQFVDGPTGIPLKRSNFQCQT